MTRGADEGAPDGGSRRATRVKVCGVTNAEDRDAAVAAGADAIGLIAGVTVDTPREVDLDTAADLARNVPPLVTSTLVTMPEDPATAVDRVERVGPDAVQVHGLAPDEVAELADALAAPDGPSASVVAAADAEAGASTLAAYAEAADALLVDSVDEEGGGGTGETHDWERTSERVAGLDTPVILAGGLTPENVAAAVATVDPFAVDVASGVEREGGLKDHDAVRRFVRGATGEVTPA
ncbi:N-(5'-phosphoribosyl)anthranilate isomerase [Halobacteriales archaeon QH_3_68_24]|nr:MAG: N-(5'-phosphoribosyl)anthranilate isomerase [Halobacteriales archaeon QH_3_68_24]